MDVDIHGAGSLQSVDRRAGMGCGDTTLGAGESSTTRKSQERKPAVTSVVTSPSSSNGALSEMELCSACDATAKRLCWSTKGVRRQESPARQETC